MTEAPQFDDVLESYLTPIDEMLAKDHVALNTRPFEAACFFVKELVVEISNGTKERFLEQPWFTALYGDIRAWYVDKYGAAAMAPPRDPLRTAIVIGGVTFAVLVPRTTSRVEVKGKTAWLSFPAGIEDGEDPLAWIVAPPNLARFSDIERARVTERLREFASSLRSVWLDVMSADFPDALAEALGDKVLAHLQSAAGFLLSGKAMDVRLSMWEAHQAVESALKLLCRQHSGTHCFTHDLEELHAGVPASQRSQIEATILRQLPAANAAVQLRAGEWPSVDPSAGHDTYLAAVRATRQCCAVLRSKGLRVHNASILLRKVPWAT